MTIGRCDDCGHPYTVYEWGEGFPLSRAVCPIHGTPLARTTYPKDLKRVIVLEVAPRAKNAEAHGKRLRSEPRWEKLSTLLIATLLALFVVGCAEVRIAPDASAGDAPVTLRNGCGDLFNTFDTYGADCDRAGLHCPWTEPVEEARIQECNRALYEARDSCEAMTAALESCR